MDEKNNEDITKKFTEDSLDDFDQFDRIESETLEETKKINLNLKDLKKEFDNNDKDEKSDESVSNFNDDLENSRVAKLNQNNKNSGFMSENSKTIEFKNVGLEINNELILEKVNLDIYKGEFVYLVGESGAGKSSMIKMIYREVTNTKGNLIVKNRNVTQLKSRALPKLRRMVGVIFQDYKLLRDKTIFENVAYVLRVTNFPQRKIKHRVEESLKKVGIYDQRSKYPDELSGGQQQRAAIARAIVGEPEILVADEPTGNLDPENALGIMEILERINNEGTTIVMATHDVGIVNNFPKRVVLLGSGSILKESEGEYIYE